MHITTDPNALSPLTQLANQALQDQVRKVPEFATSSRWGATAIVLQLAEGPAGYEVRIGFELRTPLDEPIQDTVTHLAESKEAAVRQTVAEWLAIAFNPAMRIHAKNDAAARLGETVNTAQNRVYMWRMAEGPPHVVSASAIDVAEAKKELSTRSLFDRLGMAEILPMEREVPIMVLKMQLTRAAAAEGGTVTYECRLNNSDWPEGLERLKRFHLPRAGVMSPAMRVTQYCFLRRTGKAAVKPVVTAAPAPAAKSAPAKKKPWWKFW